MIKSISFQTRARAVDHLGREQIADCPTAISELWKNAYDAYARKVALHIFSSDNQDVPPVAAIVDDGHGMNEEEFRTKWFVIGTDSKLSSSNDSDEEDRNGLPVRIRQGQKGIGRLSSGAMGSLLLLLSKRKNSDFVAALIDWRLFENPYLLLNDILIPITTFSNAKELPALLDNMYDELLSNVEPGATVSSERAERLRSAWRVYSQFEANNGQDVTTAEKITSTIISMVFSERHFQEWNVWTGEAVKGTALFFANIHDDLLYQLNKNTILNDTVEEIDQRFKKTLAGFIDPFIASDKNLFKYKVIVWRGSIFDEVISDDAQYDWQTFCGLEHIIDGQIDVQGVFHGRIKAFGEYRDNIKILPNMNLPQKGVKFVGPIDIKIGTYEQVKTSSTLTEDAFGFWEEQCNVSSGMGVYRDDLRVLPYGREDNDFFEIEYRRSKHAGREFWVSRRLFGRILITKSGNPNLRDKAGREGFIDNTAKNLFKALIVDLLKETARKFFGTDSNIRKETLPAIQKENAKREKEEAAKARKSNLKYFQKKLNHSIACFGSMLVELKNLSGNVENAICLQNTDELYLAKAKVRELDIQRAELRLPSKPTRSTVFDDKINQFDSDYKTIAHAIDSLAQQIDIKIDEFAPQPPLETLELDARNVRSYFTSKLNAWSSEIEKINAIISNRLQSARDNQEQKIKEELLVLASDLQSGEIDIADALKRQREIRSHHIDIINSYYSAFVNVLTSMAEGIDIDSATRYSIKENERLEQELDRFTGLAQLGITVEIVGHELERWEYSLSYYLKNLPSEIQNTSTYKDAVSAQKELTDSLRFLSPLKLSGRSYSRGDISGIMIEDAIMKFFHKIFADNHITFSSSEIFRKISINDWTSDIYPVFLNIINNACYWVCQSASATLREIKIDVIGNAIIIADSGPGVLPADQEYLFQLFFSKRINGRGVGLYLCRRNLTKSNHQIEYISDDSEKILPGANFKIIFSGMQFK